MRKNDWILISSILLIAVAFFVLSKVFMIKSDSKGAEAVVTIDGSEYGRYPLSEDFETVIEFEDGAYNRLVIKDGYADIDEASCPDQICVDHFRIHYRGETIVCLPNKLVVEIVGGDENKLDGSTF